MVTLSRRSTSPQHPRKRAHPLASTSGEPTRHRTTERISSAERSTLPHTDHEAGDESSLTSLSDLEERLQSDSEDDGGDPTFTLESEKMDGEQRSTGKARESARKADKGKGKATQQTTKAVKRVRRARSPERRNDGDFSRSSSLTNRKKVFTKRTAFVAPPTPILDALLSRTTRDLLAAITEATDDYNLQGRSEELVQRAVESLPTGEQQTMMCLAMNRYSAFCALDQVNVPPFPMTAFKIALFLSRALDTPTYHQLLEDYPQPPTYPLPLVAASDPAITVDEGTRLTRELVESWIQAFGFAQLSTIELWETVFVGLGIRHTTGSSSLVSLSESRAIRELIEAIPTMGWWSQQASTVPDGTGAMSAKKTRWVKGGRAVAGPVASGTPSYVCQFLELKSSAQSLSRAATHRDHNSTPVPPQQELRGLGFEFDQQPSQPYSSYSRDRSSSTSLPIPPPHSYDQQHRDSLPYASRDLPEPPPSAWSSHQRFSSHPASSATAPTYSFDMPIPPSSDRRRSQSYNAASVISFDERQYPTIINRQQINENSYHPVSNWSAAPSTSASSYRPPADPNLPPPYPSNSTSVFSHIPLGQFEHRYQNPPPPVQRSYSNPVLPYTPEVPPYVEEPVHIADNVPTQMEPPAPFPPTRANDVSNTTLSLPPLRRDSVTVSSIPWIQVDDNLPSNDFSATTTTNDFRPMEPSDAFRGSSSKSSMFDQSSTGMNGGAGAYPTPESPALDRFEGPLSTFFNGR